MEEKRERVQLIDALRGLCVVMMVIHHFFFDLVEFLNAPAWLFSNSIFDILHYIFAGLFILLSGVSSRFSRSNIKRGLKVIGAALVITAVTLFIDMPIYFGILHFLGLSMVIYGLTKKLLDKIPQKIQPIIYVLLLIASAVFIGSVNIESRFLWMFGITYPGFYSADYFPLLPWIFVFLLGTWVGYIIRKGSLPDRFYTAKPPLLPAIGRRAFILYLVHQPVLYVITLGIGKLLDIN